MVLYVSYVIVFARDVTTVSLAILYVRDVMTVSPATVVVIQRVI